MRAQSAQINRRSAYSLSASTKALTLGIYHHFSLMVHASMVCATSFFLGERVQTTEVGEDHPRFRAALTFSMILMVARVVTSVPLGFAVNLWLLFEAACAVAVSLFLARRGFPRLAALATCYALYRIGALAITQFMFGALFLGRSFPIADATLSKADLWLNLDWTAYASTIVLYPRIDYLLRFAYNSIYWQPLFIVVVLVAWGRFREAFALLSAIPLGIMAVSLIALTMPAYGTVHYYGFQPGLSFETADKMAATIDWLRSPARNPPSDLYFGLVSFPSFHAIGAILFLWACRNMRSLLALMVPLNIGLLLATPVQGSHYFVDVFAGIILAVILVAFNEFMLNYINMTTANIWPPKRLSDTGDVPSHGAPCPN